MKRRNGDRNQLFLFVNKNPTSKSLSKSEGASAKQINRHAQQVRSRRLAQQKASTARNSSSSARRIALGGWNRRDEDITVTFEATSPASPTGTSIRNDPAQFDPSSNDVTPTSSRDHSSASPPSSSPSTASPERSASEDDGGHSPRTWQPEQDGGRLSESPISPATPRDAFSPADGVDPFGQLPIKINEHIHAALQHALRIYPYSGNNYKFAYIPQHMKASMNQFPITQVVHRSVYHEHHLYSLLSIISIRLKSIFGRDMNGQSPAMYRANAAHHLRQELIRNSESGNIDKHTILDILFLCVSEIAHGEYESAHKHLDVVSQLYHILDVREHFDFWISESAAHVDNQLALSTGGRPVLPFDFDPGPMLPERMAALKRELKSMFDQEIADSYRLPNPRSLTVANAPHGHNDAIADLAANVDLRMGTHFERGLKVGVFSVQMSRIVRDLVDCVAIAKVVWLSPHAVCFDAEWLCRKARAVMRSLLAMAPENNIGPQDLLGKCMESARLTMLIMMSHACTLIGFQTAKANVARLQKAMSFALEFWCPVVGLTTECAKLDDRELDPFVMIQLGFILFSTMTGMLSASECPVLEEWFLVRAINVCRILAIRNSFELEEHLVSYLYSRTLQEASLRKVAARLEQG